MHWIQKDILKKLAKSKGLRYIELKPDSVDGNLFMYHLKQLISDGYIEKNEKNYSLTKEGKRFVGGTSISTGKQVKQPRVFVMLYCINEKEELLLYKWSRQPYLGHVSLPFSRLRYGQSVTETLKEVIKYKTNLSGQTKHLADIYVLTKDQKTVRSHYLAHIFLLDKISGKLTADGLTGQPFWQKPDNYSEKLIDGTAEIIKTIEKNDRSFFKEIIIKKTD